MKISVIGCGYLGAVHAASLVELGHEVVGVDVDQRKVTALCEGRAPFYEPDFGQLLAHSLASGRLRFTTDVDEAAGAGVHFLCVGTPQKHGEYAADLRFVRAAAESLLRVLEPGDLVVGKSTVPVGTAAELALMFGEKVPGALVAWNPEFLREGFAVRDALHPDRLVYGLPSGEDGVTARALLDEVYRPIVARGTPQVVTDYATAETVKTAATSFLAPKISFFDATAETRWPSSARPPAPTSSCWPTRPGTTSGSAARSSTRASASGAAACPRTSGRSRPGRGNWARTRR